MLAGGAVKPGLHAYNAMVQLRATAADSIGASEVYQQMRADGIRPDVCTFIHLFEVHLLSCQGLGFSGDLWSSVSRVCAQQSTGFECWSAVLSNARTS